MQLAEDGRKCARAPAIEDVHVVDVVEELGRVRQVDQGAGVELKNT